MSAVEHALTGIVLAGASVAALIVLFKAMWWAHRFVQRLELVHDTVIAELLPNGGTSLKDQIGRIDQRVAVIEATQARESPQP